MQGLACSKLNKRFKKLVVIRVPPSSEPSPAWPGCPSLQQPRAGPDAYSLIFEVVKVYFSSDPSPAWSGLGPGQSGGVRCAGAMRWLGHPCMQKAHVCRDGCAFAVC